jgi:TonB family protein
MEVEVVAGDTHRVVHPGSNSVKVEMPPNSGSRVAASTAFTWSPATNAAERTRLSADQPDALPPSAETSYPSLAKEMKVQGSVLLQAFVGTDGGIRHLRVLSGNPILVSAALEAARQWRFTPYLQNGQPVETQAKIMVNFTIKVL